MRLRSSFIIGLALSGAAAAAPRPAPRPSPQALALARDVRDNRAQASGVEAQIAHLREQLVALAAIEASGERASGGKAVRLEVLRRKEVVLAQRLGDERNATARLLSALALYRRDPPPALLVHPQSARDAVRAQILARALEPELKRRSAALAAQLADLQRLRRQAAVASEDLFTSESAQADQRSQLEQMLADKAALERSLLANAAASETRLRALAAASGDPAALIGRLPPDEAADEPLPPRFVDPVQGRLVARYGQAAWRNGPKEGFAWKAGAGAPVLAPVSGLIDYAGPLKDYGVVLILKAQGAYHLVLTGLGATDAVAGRAVAAGEPVGRMAEDAGSPRTLYLEVRRGGTTLDPARWFKALSGVPNPRPAVQ